jgi:hypothetical protein
MIKIFTIVILVCYASIWQSCNVVNTKEPTPFFIQVDSATVSSLDYGLHGATSSKISDVWVYYNNNLLGGFELPAKVPIIGELGGIVTLQAGVLRNGLQADRNRYAFYTLKNYPIDWAAGNSKKIIPDFQYVPFAMMKMNVHEDFELGNSFTKINEDTPIVRSNNAIYGAKCGWMALDSLHNQSENIIEQKLNLLQNKVYYLEIDYKCDVPITVNVLCTDASGITSIQPLGGMNPKPTWNKIYFDLGALVSAVKAKEYNLIISSYLPNGTKTGSAFIDNIKIIGPR